MGTISLSDFEDVSIMAPWGEISGRWYGNRNERPILALHGWLDNLGTFDTLIPQLPDYLGVLCIDLPGHGRSSWQQPGVRYDMLDYTLIIARVMNAYQWQRVSLLGHSLGGVLGLIFTTLNPHMVDMLIMLDIVLPMPSQINGIKYIMEKQIIEEERIEQLALHEPPSYTPEQLCELICKGSGQSVPLEYAHHLLYRSVTKSQLYPDKYYFSRDGRCKYYNSTHIDEGLAAAMMRRIKNKPVLILKGSESFHIGARAAESISILRAQNTHFEYHEVPGTHHVHLHNAAGCAQYIVPFLRHHRPPSMVSWSLPADENAKLSKQQRRRQQERFFVWHQKRRQKSQKPSKL